MDLKKPNNIATVTTIHQVSLQLSFLWELVLSDIFFIFHFLFLSYAQSRNLYAWNVLLNGLIRILCKRDAIDKETRSCLHLILK